MIMLYAVKKYGVLWIYRMGNLKYSGKAEEGEEVNLVMCVLGKGKAF